MSRRTLIVTGIVVLAALLGAAYYFSMYVVPKTPKGGQASLPTQTLTIAHKSIVAEIAVSDTERKIGLSGRPSLPDGHGMLFVFPKDGNWGIWMPDMLFSIDILWTDAAGKVVALDSNISPATYPNIFYPNNNARYVLELPVGYAGANGFTVGSMMSLPHQ